MAKIPIGALSVSWLPQKDGSKKWHVSRFKGYHPVLGCQSYDVVKGGFKTKKDALVWARDNANKTM